MEKCSVFVYKRLHGLLGLVFVGFAPIDVPKFCMKFNFPTRG
jgi:hypothetical protein